MVTLCVDAGTTVIKTVAYDDAGQLITTAKRPTRISSPSPGFAEQDMREVWTAVAATLREAASDAGGHVTLIALTGQGDGCWLVDGDGNPTGPAILWNDGRAASLVADWFSDGRVDRAFRINGSVGFAGLPHAILSWLAEHEPDRIARSHAALTCGGWLFQRLTGEVAIDESEAAAPWLDVGSREYSTELLELFDLSWAKRLLPELRRDDDRVAGLSSSAAEELGFTPDVPVVLAPYDLATTSIGAGAVAERDACSILGTTLSTQVVMSSVDLSGPVTGLTVPLGVGDLYLRALPTLAGTQVLDWAADMLNVPDAGAVSALGASVEPGSGGVLFLPYLSPAGERAPFVDASARGAFVGLSIDHDREQLARAVLEGLSYVIRDCLETSSVGPSQLHVCGGGAGSAHWCQLIADVTGVPVVRSMDTEVGARGAYCCALVATGRDHSHAAAVAAHVRRRDEFVPDSRRHAIYDGLFEDFLSIRADAARSWPRLERVRSGGTVR